jgi:hypothetical protein
MSILIHPKHLAGLFAMSAVRQSPYLVPDNLEQAIVEFMAGFDCTQPLLEWAYPLECSQAVKDSIMKSPLCLAWNNRKNGREGMGFTSRFDQPHPDDDFIDLDALQMNICREIFKDQP